MRKHISHSKPSLFNFFAILFLSALLLCLFVAPGCKKQTPSAPQQTASPNKPAEPNKPAPAPADANEVAAVEPAMGESSTFDLEEVSTFDLPQEIRYRFILGQYTLNVNTEPEEKVKAYPDFESDNPLYGSMTIGGEADKPETGILYHFAIDESQGTDRGYDWLYFDTDGDGDLSDETSLKPLQNVPDSAKLSVSSDETQICFEHIKIKTAPNSTALLEVMPRVLIYSNVDRRYMFIVPVKSMKGQVTIAGEKYNAFLGYGNPICSGLDSPSSMLHLSSTQDMNNRPLEGAGTPQLKAMPLIDGKYYCFSASSDGHKLTVGTYQGPYGTLKLGPGDRDIQEMTISGSVLSKDFALALTQQPDQTTTEKATTFKLPVGDYTPRYISIKYGDLQLSILQNAHSDGAARDTEKPTIYGMKIREDKPFVLDFSNEPKVIFASPAKDYRIKRGEELQVAAVLTDPVLDIMYRVIRESSSSSNDMLNPTVTISRSDGEQLAEGVMPFG